MKIKVITIIISLLIICIAAGCTVDEPIDVTAEPTLTPEPTPEIESIAIIIAFDNCQAYEFTEAVSVLEENGYNYDVYSQQSGTAQAMMSQTIEVDYDFSQFDGSKYVGLLIIGGNGTTDLFDNEQVHDIVNSTYSEGKPIGAVCLAPFVLAKAGVLKDQIATWYSDSVHNQIMDENNVTRAEEDFYVNFETNISTGNGPSAAMDMAKGFVELLQNQN